MAVNIFENIVSTKQQKTLLQYYEQQDDVIDSRPDVFSKTPIWDKTKNWPQNTLKEILDSVLDVQYEAETVLFYSSLTSFRLHVDSGEGNQSKLYKNILIPLWFDGPASTIIFKNKYYGASTRFGHSNVSPFTYNIPDKQGKMVAIEDIRELKDISTLNITQEQLDDLILLRSGKKPNSDKPDRRTNDYTDVEGYDANLTFDEKIHAQYCEHIPIENLHGLTVDRIVEWKAGDVITFDRQQLHCAGSGHTKKMGISVFTNHIHTKKENQK